MTIPSLNAKQDLSLKAVDLIKKTEKDMKESGLYATEIYDLRLITTNRIYRVSTADTIPFRNWYVVINESGTPMLHSFTKIRQFNSFIKSESMRLRTKKDFYSYMEVFAAIAIQGESLADDNFKLNKEHLKDEFKKIPIKKRVVKTPKGLYRLTFFTTDSTGSVKIWRITITSSGLVRKIKRANITYG